MESKLRFHLDVRARFRMNSAKKPSMSCVLSCVRSCERD